MKHNVVYLISSLLGIITLLGCTPVSKPLPTSEPTPIVLPSPQQLPQFLREVRPFPSSIITHDEYQAVITGTLQEGPPPPPVEKTGLRSSVCIDLDVATLVEPGDSLFWDREVLPRIELKVDDRILTERNKTEYLAVIEPGPACKCFYDCDNADSRDWDKDHTPPQNTGCYFWPGFWCCYPVEFEAGIHTATFSFKRTSGQVESYSWTFAITE